MIVFVIQLLVVLYNVGSVHNQCVMQGVCSESNYGYVPCSSNAKFDPIAFTEGSTSLELLNQQCPDLSSPVCCDHNQLIKIRSLVKLISTLLPGCPQCINNIRQLICRFTCATNQQEFVQVLKTTPIKSRTMVNEVNYFIDDQFAQDLFESCKDLVAFGSVKLGQFICNLYRVHINRGLVKCDYRLLFKFFGSSRNAGGYAPFQMNFHFANQTSVEVNGQSFKVDKLSSAKCSQSSGKLKPCPCHLCEQSCYNANNA